LIAAILNDVLAVFSRVTLFQPHRLLTVDAGNQREERAAVIVHHH
jgi:hypothetical protein